MTYSRLLLYMQHCIYIYICYDMNFSHSLPLCIYVCFFISKSYLLVHQHIWGGKCWCQEGGSIALGTKKVGGCVMHAFLSSPYAISNQNNNSILPFVLINMYSYVYICVCVWNNFNIHNAIACLG